jgi:hypothetical protein
LRYLLNSQGTAETLGEREGERTQRGSTGYDGLMYEAANCWQFDVKKGILMIYMYTYIYQNYIYIHMNGYTQIEIKKNLKYIYIYIYMVKI